jgi:hypothetical protein
MKPTDESPADNQRKPPRAGEEAVGRPRRRVRRRRVVQVATASVVGVLAASGYVKPGVRPFQIATAHAFSF